MSATHEKPLYLPIKAIRALVAEKSETYVAEMTTERCKMELGQRYWVRETWAPVDHILHGYDLQEPVAVAYKADQTSLDHSYGGPYPLDTYGWRWEQVKWRSPVTMPRWASRLTVTVKEVSPHEVVLVRSGQ